MTSHNTPATVSWQTQRVCSVRSPLFYSYWFSFLPEAASLTFKRSQVTLHSSHSSLPLVASFCTPSPTTSPGLPPHFAAVRHGNEGSLSYAIYGLKDGVKGIWSQRLKVIPFNPWYGQKNNANAYKILLCKVVWDTRTPPPVNLKINAQMSLDEKLMLSKDQPIFEAFFFFKWILKWKHISYN